MEPEILLLCLQVPTSCICLELDESSPRPFHYSSLRFILKLSFHLGLGLKSRLFDGIKTLATFLKQFMYVSYADLHNDLYTTFVQVSAFHLRSSYLCAVNLHPACLIVRIVFLDKQTCVY